jgi:hypothetical protein
VDNGYVRPERVSQITWPTTPDTTNRG